MWWGMFLTDAVCEFGRPLEAVIPDSKSLRFIKRMLSREVARGSATGGARGQCRCTLEYQSVGRIPSS